MSAPASWVSPHSISRSAPSDNLNKSATGDRKKGSPLVVDAQIMMTGDVVTDARVQRGDLPNSRVVSLTLNSRGAQIFEEVTAANVNRRFAIVLDNTVD